MKKEIIYESIQSLKQEGLKFSIDTLSERLKISKKTVYKYFPDKETLALALYETYYDDAMYQAEILAARSQAAYADLLHLYLDSKMMMRHEIFNKYKLNDTIYAFAVQRNDLLWDAVSASFRGKNSEKDTDVLRIIIDGSFEKLTHVRANQDAVIERLVELL